MFSCELSSVISNVSVADFDHVFVCWERYFWTRKTTVAVLILEYFT